MKFFLKIKHWQLFILLFGVPMIVYFVVFASVFFMREPDLFESIFQLIMLVMLFFMTIFFSWFYSLGTNLHKMLPDTVSMNLTRFKFFLFVPVAYLVFIVAFMYTVFNNFNENQSPHPGIMLLIVPLHLFSMFCIFYCLYFNAKVLKSVQLQRKVTFGDFVGEIFLFMVLSYRRLDRATCNK